MSTGRLESCWSCRRPVFLAERLVAGGKLRHRTCFTCKRCGHQLNVVGYYETENGDFVCETCPDEEKRGDTRSQTEPWKSEDVSQVVKDDSCLNFKSALEPIVQNRRDDSKTKFLQELVEDSESVADFSKTMTSSDLESVDVSFTEDCSVKNFPPDGANDNQCSIVDIENLKFKIKNLLGRDFSDTLSLLNQESDSFIADISEIIDNIINDAVKKAENHVEESLNCKLSSPDERKGSVEIKLIDPLPININENDTLLKVNKEDKEEDALNEKEKLRGNESNEELRNQKRLDICPKNRNPFDEDEEEMDEKLPVNPRKALAPVVRPRSARFNKTGQKIIEAPKVNLNPFWSDGEPSSDEDFTKPVPAPRTSLRISEKDSPFSRSQCGSFTSLSSIGSAVGGLKRKKGPAPLPPPETNSLHHPSYSEFRSPSLTPTNRSRRKSKPAPPPPSVSLNSVENELMAEKKEKNFENKIKQNLCAPDKSTYGKWKKKKGQAPGLPIPQKRRITPLPMPEVYRELEDLEIQQRELERQGVTIEQTIRKYEAEALEGKYECEIVEKDIEGLILQLFDIVNQKNELFRRQAELMLLRRQQRLEEEHADIEYQIRCLMGRPERNKTDSDKAQEEELIRKLVEVVERRNEIIECLDMDRKREVEEDESIHHHLEAFAGKKALSEEKHKSISKGSPSLLKYIKKKKYKKEKSKESPIKSRRDIDKDIDETNKEENMKILKTKKKWFPKS